MLYWSCFALGTVAVTAFITVAAAVAVAIAIVVAIVAAVVAAVVAVVVIIVLLPLFSTNACLCALSFNQFSPIDLAYQQQHQQASPTITTNTTTTSKHDTYYRWTVVSRKLLRSIENPCIN